MTYIALLVALLVGGYTAYQQYQPAPTGSTTIEQGSPLSAIQAAKDVVAAVEKREGVTVASSTKDAGTASAIMPEQYAKMLVAGGCFWCTEADLEKLPGVSTVVSGYVGGTVPNPTYQTYAETGYREAVEVTYDTNKVTFEQILIYAMKHMDPTDDHGSFHDQGDQYAPAFYYANDSEKKTITDVFTDMTKNGPYKKPLAIDVEPVSMFYPAEAYHQDYYKGSLTQFKYQFYRNASGRDAFIQSVWGKDTGPTLPWRTVAGPTTTTVKSLITQTNSTTTLMWKNYVKPDAAILQTKLDPVTFKVTQEQGTERSGSSPFDHNFEPGIYVDILSGEPLFSSKDKFDSGTGWPSFVKPIEADAVTERSDNTFFSKRTEVRSAIADDHLGHVFNDGPADRGGMRYCMNGVAMKFIPKAEMEAAGYSNYLSML